MCKPATRYIPLMCAIWGCPVLRVPLLCHCGCLKGNKGTPSFCGVPKSAEVSACLEKGAFCCWRRVYLSWKQLFKIKFCLRREIGRISRKQVSACRSGCRVSAFFSREAFFFFFDFPRKFLPPGPFGRKCCRRRVQVYPPIPPNPYLNTLKSGSKRRSRTDGRQTIRANRSLQLSGWFVNQ